MGTIKKKNRWRDFKYARKFARSLGIKNLIEWRKYCMSCKKPEDIPSNPMSVYKYKGWYGLGDWLGTGAIATRLIVYLPFEEAREFVRCLGIKNKKEWDKYCESGKKPVSIPANPYVTHINNGWMGWGDWLGTGKVANKNIVYRSFENAREFVHGLGIKSWNEWIEYCASGKKPNNIPANPNVTYKNKGWKGMGDWSGTGRISNKNRVYRSFEDARKFVRSLGINSQREWGEYCKSGNKPDDIPTNPWRSYKKSGWKGMGDWFGTGTIANHSRIYRSFEDARRFVHGLGIKSWDGWVKYCRSGKKPNDIPTRPSRIYRKKF